MFKNKLLFPILLGSLLIISACGRTDFDPNHLPDAGTDASSDTDVIEEGCGNGIKENDEECDNGKWNSNEPNASCREDCTLQRCGDNIVDSEEFEECDEGEANSNEPGALCRLNCTIGGCGDGIVDPGEECDMGSLNSDEPGAQCRTNCIQGGCGDGIIDPGRGEQCDDGNNVNTDDCTNECLNSTCGDGIVNETTENCDDGNSINDKTCSADCQDYCGDGVINKYLGEQCDDGTDNSDLISGACRTNCSFATCGDGVFDYQHFCLSTPYVFPAQDNIIDVTTADFNNDGFKDIILCTTSKIMVYAFTETGYKNTWSSATLSEPVSPIVADFNGDSILDIAVVESGVDKIALVNGNNSTGAPTFSSINRFNLNGNNSSRATFGDFSGNGYNDIIVLLPYSGKLERMTNDGNGNFTSDYIDVCSRPRAIASGHLDTDGNMDFAITCYSSGLVQIYKNNGSGGFTLAPPVVASSYPVDLEIADVNNDSLNDLIVLKKMSVGSSPEVSVYKAQQNGSFVPNLAIQGLPNNAEFIEIGHYNRNPGTDTHLDLAVSCDDGINIFENDGTGNFTEEKFHPWPASPGNFHWADLNNDMKYELLTPGGIEAGLLAPIDSISLPFPENFSFPDIGIKGTVGDFSGDGQADAILVTNNQSLYVYQGDGNGNFTNWTLEDQISNLFQVVTINDPDYPDLLVVKTGENEMELRPNPSGIAGTSQSFVPGSSVPQMAKGGLDLNGDQFLDAAILFSDTSQLIVYLGGSNPIQASFNVGSGPTAFASGDINGDGNIDFAVLDGDGSTLNILLNDGSGTFTATAGGTIQDAHPTVLDLLDLDNDGIPELLAGYSSTKQIKIYKINFASASLDYEATVNLSCSPIRTVVTDHDSNLTKDLMVFCQDGYKVRWLYPDTDSLVLHGAARTTVNQYSDCLPGDLNTDGVLDYVCISDSQTIYSLLTSP
ncbi:MAG: FG-GAP-like repeat-containing protein [Myxococcota bacterium]